MSLANALIHPLLAGTIAMFDVIAPSSAFNVDTNGRACPCGHNVRNPIGPGGTTVAFVTCACALAGIPPPLPLTATSSEAMGADPAGFRVSTTRQGVTLYSDNPPVLMGAK